MQRTRKYLNDVLKEFFDVSTIKDIEEINGGHINSTYMVMFPECRYVLQQINHHVFKSPLSVMNNMVLITNHIMKKCVYEGKSKNRSGLNLVPTRYDQYIAMVDGDYWRCTEFIEGGICYDEVKDAHIFNEVGKAVGNFHYMLEGLHSRVIDDPIPYFHDTPRRYKNFVEVVKNADKDLVKSVQKEIDYINSKVDILDCITSKIEDGSLRRRICHNDTKLSNVMMDAKTGKYMCLIDLDTAMKGAIAYDFGDAIRGGASTAQEDETDLTKVTIDLELTKAFTDGFIYELRNRKDKEEFLTKEEAKSLYNGLYIISLELGMRFLEDYLSGNIYFKIDADRPKHNLDRARNQLKLAQEIEKHRAEIVKIINNALKNNGFDDSYLMD